MISARAALLSHLRAFVETELCGIVRYDELEHSVPENETPEPGKRPRSRPLLRETVEVRFGNYTLAVHSPADTPPLGNICLQFLGGREEGPLDVTTWARMGALIRNRQNPRGTHA